METDYPLPNAAQREVDIALAARLEQRRREQEAPRATAMRLAGEQETAAGDNSTAAAAARRITAAVVAGHETTAAALLDGDPVAARDAAQAFEQQRAGETARRQGAIRRTLAVSVSSRRP